MRISFLFFSLFLFSCNSSQSKKCQFGTPSPIFSSEMESVIEHSFNSATQEGNENILFDNDLKVEIEQSGCEHIKQVFKFWIDRPGEGEPNWYFLAAEQFAYLSNISDETKMLGMWAEVIESNASQFKLSKPVEVDSGFFVKIDKIAEDKKVILVVELSQNLYPSNIN